MHTTQNYHYCLLGAIGWDHPHWNGTVYPDDLPAEWRLNYYNTLFECVYLPYADWHALPLETLQAWHHTTLDHFRFLLEPPPEANPAPAQLAALGEKALLVHPAMSLLWLAPEIPLKRLAQSLQALENARPIYLVSRSGDFAQLEQARILLEVMGY